MMRSWQGKSVFVNFIIPCALLLFLRIIAVEPAGEKKVVRFYWLMLLLLSISSGLCSSMASILTMGYIFLAGILAAATYNIIEIEEETTPLAVAPEFSGAMTAGIFAIAILLVVLAATASYFGRCMNYRKRIRQLTDDTEVYHGWNEGRLRDTVTELEIDKLRATH